MFSMSGSVTLLVGALGYLRAWYQRKSGGTVA
jgi:hypothetical protein